MPVVACPQNGYVSDILEYLRDDLNYCSDPNIRACRHEQPECRSGALELQCGASQKVYGGNLSLFSGEFGVHIHLN